MKRLNRSAICLVPLLFSALMGCSLWHSGKADSDKKLEQWAETSSARLVGDLAVGYGMHPITIESVGLVTGLRNTGSDPYPSPQRSYLLDEMRKRGVENPNTVLASPATALVLIRGYLPPGIQKGERFDVEVRVPSRTDTTSLRGGYLLAADLREMAVLGNYVREGHPLGAAEGPVLVDPAADPEKDQIYTTRGVVLGGGVSRTDRTLGLVLKPGARSVRNAARIETAINRRFYIVKLGIHEGIATAKTDEYVELRVPPRYRNNVDRFLHVARSVPLRDTETQRIKRLGDLKERLLAPETAAAAALELEAIGQEAIDTLKQGLDSDQTDVRFYAAEALAYLDDPAAAEPLGEIARHEPAFRVFALAALGNLNDLVAIDQLHNLLSSSSAETRYGAFRALTTLNPNDPVIMGEMLERRFHYHVLNVDGPPMIHVTRSKRPEVVLFGANQRLQSPFALEAGNLILVTSQTPGKATVARFAVGEADQKRFVSDSVDEIIRAIVDLGGTYPDVVQALQEAKATGVLKSRFEVDALPEAGRRYQRDDSDAIESSRDDDAVDQLETEAASDEATSNEESPSVDAETNPSTDDTPTEGWRSLLGWFTGK